MESVKQNLQYVKAAIEKGEMKKKCTNAFICIE